MFHICPDELEGLRLLLAQLDSLVAAVRCAWWRFYARLWRS